MNAGLSKGSGRAFTLAEEASPGGREATTHGVLGYAGHYTFLCTVLLSF